MLEPSTRIRYGLRCLLELSRRQDHGPVSLRAIAETQDVSMKYLESIFHLFRQAGIVQSVRGGAGGYMLSRSPEAITVKDVVEAIDGPFNLIKCLEDPSACKRAETCETRDFWAEFQGSVSGFLGARSLRDLLSKSPSKGLDGMYI